MVIVFDGEKGNVSLERQHLLVYEFVEVRSMTLYAFWVGEYPIKTCGLALGSSLALLCLEVETKHQQPNVLRWERSSLVW